MWVGGRVVTSAIEVASKSLLYVLRWPIWLKNMLKIFEEKVMTLVPAGFSCSYTTNADAARPGGFHKLPGTLTG